MSGMHTIRVDAATQKMRRVIEEMDADNLHQVYNELFPDRPATEEQAYEDTAQLLKQVLGHMDKGLEPEEAVDLWNVVFPWGRRLYFDDEDNLLHFTENQSIWQDV